MKRTWKIILTAGAILIVALLGVGWYLNLHWKSVLDKELRRYVAESSDSLYTLAYGKISLNLLTGNLAIQNVALIPDSAVYARLVARQQAPRTLYQASMGRVMVSRLKLWRYFLGKQVDAGAFILSDPEIIITEDRRSIDTGRQRSFYEAINKNIKSFDIGRISLQQTTLRYTRIAEDSSQQITRLNNLDVEIRGLAIDSISQKDPTRFLYARNFDINLDKWDYRTPDSLYWLYVNKISYHAIERALDVGEVRLEPRYNRAEFDKRLEYQQDRYEMAFRNIRLEGLPRMHLLEKKILMNKATINGGYFHAYRNRGLPMAPGDKYGQFPNQVLAKFGVPLRVDTLVAANIDVSYTERNPQNGETGQIQFQRAGGTFRHITNIDSLVKENGHCTADLHAILMKSGKLKARFDFVLGAADGAFSVTGQLNDMDGREFNTATKPLGMVEIRSARINQLNFDLRGNERSAAGTLSMRYSALRIAMLREEKNGKGTERKGLASLLANLMAIHNENPSPGQPLRVAKPRFTRHPKKSFFNLVWKTIFTGVKETVGTEMLESMGQARK
ncbi:hypothetical protein DLD77_08770 [Chitinophaga alhagiae]|uniref:DUF748 domain-containing protein n=1 Tax=Chitinophaga alhagiae TaxID=2203219 RepID=A0ABM6WCU6_9BACT|nr:hypothetical protein [Chitinophaga alhagiae]AWO01780.1 hypothetical protein DLD77_08770 [Chitinophaga alhagiae]